MSMDPSPRLVPPRYHATPRDLALLRDVWLFRYLTAVQVSRLHFGHLKIAQRRLRKITALDLVRRFRLPSATPFGDQRFIYCLSRRGAREVAGAEGLAPHEILAPGHAPTALGFLAHHEILTDVRLWLREACQAHGFAYRFVPAYEEVRHGGRRRRRVALQIGATQYIPDGVFALDRAGGRSALFVLEIDRGTEPLHRATGSSVQAKLGLFRTAFDEGLATYADLFGVAFKGARLLWVVPDDSRRQAVLELAVSEDLSPLVWATTTQQVSRRGSLSEPIWFVSGRQDPHAFDE
ncbi:MAG: replication-relaxation family protein [Actinomycetota bacterium]|nr:replication-relaxation family protein [Actinomycetota bacterium]